jgi:hypothetical protein
VGEVGNTHHTERDGETLRDKEQQHSERNAVQYLRNPISHAGLMGEALFITHLLDPAAVASFLPKL